MTHEISRRNFLGSAGAIGCSLAASPLLTPVSLAAAPGDNRLVVIILRGGMDGIDVLRPWGDLSLASHRPNLAVSRDNELHLNEFYGIHP